MRLASKSTAAALIVYLMLLAGVALWMDYQRRLLTGSLMESTARLLGSEIAATISQPVADELLQADSTARGRLEQLVTDLASHSEVMASITVVGADGEVVASNEMELGKQAARPDQVFGSEKQPRFDTSEVPLGGSKYHLFVPLTRQEDIVGYLRLAISSARVEALYRRSQRQLMFVGAVGLALVAAFGVLFHVQLSRLASALAKRLEAALHGEVAPPWGERDEFAGALDTARQMGRELNAARSQRIQAEQRFQALMRVLDTGLLLVRADKALDFANEPARELLGYPAPDELERCWPELERQLENALASSGGARIDVDIPHDGRVSRLRLESYPRGESGRDGWLVLVKNREMLNALEKELRLAIQMRGFAQYYRASMHDLKAPLNAMVLNLELLKTTLSNEAHNGGREGGSEENQAEHDGGQSGPDMRERQNRCIKVLGEEIARLDRQLGSVLTQASLPSDALQRFDLRELIEDLATLLHPQARQQGVTLTTQMPEEAVPFSGHRDGLKQALLNIAINALQSMPDGGSMGIDLVAANGRASISIRDSGPGIPSQVLGDIYNIHFTTKDGGTGIGLYVARSVVESHGGEIRVDTDVGRGTCFHVDLPTST